MDNIPWVEKYRPSTFKDIIMSDINGKILNNMVRNNKFLNIILYGPPGTGKTSTIINIINSFQDKHECRDRSLVMHLNASDERGIDIIRNQISTFAKSKHLWKNGTKFVILDEVDYMTRSAQNSLRYLVDENIPNVRFCLICNYIYKLDSSLIQYFIKLRFNQVPEDKITSLLRNIIVAENINYTDDDIENIQMLCGSDIRRMINIIQCNSLGIKCIHNKDLIIQITSSIRDNTLTHKHLMDISNLYNMDIRHIILCYVKHLIRNETIDKRLLEFVESMLELKRYEPSLLSQYFITFFTNYKLN